jgi:predicted RNA methylase
MIALLLAATSFGVIPEEMTTHETRDGQWVFVRTEEPCLQTISVDKTVYETVTQMVSTCGMNCPYHLAQKEVRVPKTVTTQHEIYANAPTPMEGVEAVLRREGVNSLDLVYDLGCGDGRVCVMAATEFGARAVGLDTRAEAVEIARGNVRRNGVEARVLIHQMDAGQCRYEATVIYAYQDPSMLMKFAARIRQSKTVRTAISYQHEWPGVKCEQIGDFYVWRPERAIRAVRNDPAMVQGSRSYSMPQTRAPVFRSRGRCFG